VFELRELKQTSASQLRMVTTLTIEIEGTDKPALLADWVNVVVFSDVE
jgi:hypothetical protein